MYGLIHRSIRGYVKTTYGDTAWAQIERKANLDESAFVSMQAYPDEVTVGLLVSASEELNEPLPGLLHEFGRYWVLHTARLEYGPLFEFAGTDMLSFLRNLNAMHEQVAISFSNLQQPGFALETKEDGTLLLHYESIREGLAPFVIGLIHGLAENFHETVEVELVEAKADGAHHDVFRLRIAS
jgi:predicted hydrocarbon binding protein